MLTPLPGAPRAPRASSKKQFFVDGFMNLTHFSVKDTLTSLKNDKIHKIHAPKIQGRVFSEGAEAPQAAATQPQRAWGPLKSLKNDKIHKIHTPKLQGRVFSEVAEAPQAAATQTHRAGRP